MSPSEDAVVEPPRLHDDQAVAVAAAEEEETASHPSRPDPIFPAWTYLTEGLIHKWIRKFVVTLGSSAARHPISWVGAITFCGIAVAAIGFFTNFRAEFEQRAFLTPQGSLPDLHSDWIKSDDSGFETLRFLWLAIHSDGDNVISAKAIRRALITMDSVRTAPDYETVCSQSQFLEPHTDIPTCRIFSPTQFWDHNLTLFDTEMAIVPPEEQDDFVRQILSNATYPDGTPVFHEAILGNYKHRLVTKEVNEVVKQRQIITSAQALVFKIDIPDLGATTDKLEKQLLTRLKELQGMWWDEDEGLLASSTGQEVQVAKLDFFTLNAYQQEFQRAMNQDIPLVFVLVVIMMGFTCMVFYRSSDKVQSRGLLGIFAFATIGMSLITGYGIMFLFGVPLTNIAIMIPFVITGVALDDTFIITGAYFRRRRDAAAKEATQSADQEVDADAETVAIIEATLDEVGVSISMTTVTTLLCFLVGSISSIPAVHWLCFYAATTIAVDFIYQITFFVALLTLDERRVAANRRDLCFWIVVRDDEQDEDLDDKSFFENEPEKLVVEVRQTESAETTPSIMTESDDPKGMEDNHQSDDPKGMEDNHDNHQSDTPAESAPSESAPTLTIVAMTNGQAKQETGEQSSQSSMTTAVQQSQPKQSSARRSKQLDQNFVEKFMGWYADKLLRPWMKVFVIFAFTAYFAGSVYSTSLLYQEFNVGDYVPEDSFLTSFMVTFSEYTSIQRFIGVYFRNVDQSDPEIQRQMAEYVDELSSLPEIGEPPAFFWVRDFLASSDQAAEVGAEYGLDIEGMTFNEQVDFALSIPIIRQVYAQDIARDPVSGNITASRTFLYLRKIDFKDVKDQMRFFNIQRAVTMAQPVNSGGGELSFFTIDDMYFFWELYDITVEELIFTTVSCVVIVSVVACTLIPHWSAVLFVTPLIIMLYFDLMGTMQYCGIKINSITYFIIVMSIGLLVDFLMHMLLRYYETKGRTRHEKVKEMLETMGASILLGGFTTWLGTIPLAFSSTKIFITVFISFLAMVTLGCAVGLVLLPVLLSLVGPIDGNNEPSTATAVMSQTELASKGMVLCTGESMDQQGCDCVVVAVSQQTKRDVTRLCESGQSRMDEEDKDEEVI